MKAGELQPFLLSEAIATYFPGLGGAWETIPSIQPSASAHPQPAQGPRDPVWYQTSVMSYMQTLSSAIQATGLIITKTVPDGRPGLAPVSLGNACRQAAHLQHLPEHLPRGNLPGLPSSCSPEPAVGPGGGSGQTNS